MVVYKTYIPAGKKGISLSVPAREKIVLLSGNEAIARGAFEAGVTVASAYPGTPSTEILENFARYEGVYAEWAPNEKVSVEVAHGGARGVRDRHRRRSRNALVPERAGQPALRRRGEDPDAGAVRLLGGEGVHEACLRPLGKIRHPGLFEEHHADLPRRGGGPARRRDGITPRPRVRARPGQVGHAPGQREAAARDRRGEDTGAGYVRGRVRRQPD